MGFSCIITAPDFPGKEPLILDQWLKPVGGWMEKGEPVFVLRRGYERARFVSNMPGLLYEQAVAVGEAVDVGQPIAKAEVDGDEIPYGRQYVSREGLF